MLLSLTKFQSISFIDELTLSIQNFSESRNTRRKQLVENNSSETTRRKQLVENTRRKTRRKATRRKCSGGKLIARTNIALTCHRTVLSSSNLI